MVIKVFDNVSNKLEIPKLVLPDNGIPFNHHYKSTPYDNLIELAGRVCYDSSKSEKTRSSPDYHKHINDVGHGSVQEHCNFTIQFNYDGPGLNDFITLLLVSCSNRPGVWVSGLDNKVRITANVRSIIEWDQWNNNLLHPDQQNEVGYAIREVVRSKIPFAMSAVPVRPSTAYVVNLIDPHFPEEKWYSFHISGVSRALTHELVRHKYHTAISQRSTRYVDESDSEWVWHPLIQEFGSCDIYDKIQGEDSTLLGRLNSLSNDCKFLYRDVVSFLENKLIDRGIDKFTAKKQSRGSARGILGNSLSTELIWSASLDQVAEVIRQRGNGAADAEIRVFANNLFDIMSEDLAAAGYNYVVSDSPDGIGKVVTPV